MNSDDSRSGNDGNARNDSGSNDNHHSGRNMNGNAPSGGSLPSNGTPFNGALFFTCSLVEYIGRERKLTRRSVVSALGESHIRRIYSHADVLHCEPIAAVADAYIELADIGTGDFDNVAAARYLVPDYWTIGEVFVRLIEDVRTPGDDAVSVLRDVYGSWISDALSNYNTDFYYQPRDYIAECYRQGTVLE